MNHYPNPYYSQTQGYQPAVTPVVQSEGALGWDDEIQKEDSFVLLPTGDYQFEILKFEKAYYDGGDKISACPKAVVTFKISAPDGKETVITENYLLHSKMEWKLCEFFSSVGMKNKGEKLRMRWTPELIGKTGMCKIIVHKYKNRDGDDKETNRIDKLYPAYDLPTSTMQSYQQPNYQPTTSYQGPPMYQPKKG